jgi:hypothetical protein
MTETMRRIRSDTEPVPSKWGHWSTAHEMRFLDGLGSYGNTQRNRAKLLEGYLRSCHLRKDWGNMARELIILRVQGELGISVGSSCEMCGSKI